MTTTSRQNNLILNQDWTRIYQTFKNADFKSYDFENLRRVMITYLRENYPEDFNDYIESSEYLALIDSLAFLGQSLAFRIDLASRENFLELAERKENILRLARMLSYNAKRNISANGLLKFVSVTTTEDIRDSNGRNLAQQIIGWNDPTNTNWLEQFILILNSAMADNTEFGRNQGTSIIQGIETEQYRFRTASTDIPIFTFSKPVAGRTMVFELVSTAFKGSESIYEEPPVPGNQLGFIYRRDGAGPASPNTGFFLMFKQGSLELADFSIAVPTTNEKVSVDSQNINNDDVWLYALGSNGEQLNQWTQVPTVNGNNIAYNSLTQNVRDIYAVVTRENDKIDLVFADGVYGNLPQGTFRTYYRVSNGLTYSISPTELRGINIAIPYVNKSGVAHTVTIGLALQYTVTTATSAESTDSIKANAPAQYYTQNRMITGEDYNLAPLSSSQNVLKVKSINRTSSGISRNYDIIDASGKYSSINMFSNDGYIYKEDFEQVLTFKADSRFDVINFLRRFVEPIISGDDVYNFYLTKFDKQQFVPGTIRWTNVYSDVNITSGYFENVVDGFILKVGTYTSGLLRYVTPGSMVKFIPPTGKAFRQGKLVTANPNDPQQVDRIWTKVIRVVGDGTNAGRGILSNGTGPIGFNDEIPTGALAERVVPKFVSDLPVSLETEITNRVIENLNFGIRYDLSTTSWKIITQDNLDTLTPFRLNNAGDITGTNLDSSWIISFVKEPTQYIVRIRSLQYVFGSVEQNRFYFDKNEKAYNDKVGLVAKDTINVLGINVGNDLITTLKQDIKFEVSDTVKFDDGYESSTEIKLAFADQDDDGVIDDPEAFEEIVGSDFPQTTDNGLVLPNYVFFKEILDESGTKVDVYVDNTDGNTIILRESETTLPVEDYEVLTDGQLVYFYDQNEDRVKRFNKATNTFILESAYKGRIGRDQLKFQYVHNASTDRRIDPSSSNIIDVFILTRPYDEAFRRYIAGATLVEPLPPTTDGLKISFGTKLDAIKSISDEVIYHPVKYKILFGSTADQKLQAQFKIVKNTARTINDNDLKVRIITAINTFFDVNNWDFGDKFYLSEMITYVLNSLAPDVSNMVIVPTQPTQAFGSLFEVQSRPDEIFISGATVDDIEIVSAITAAELRASVDSIVTTT